MKQEDYDKNRQLLSQFIVDKKIAPEYTEDVPFGYIYCIENIVTHKKYIGSVYSLMIGKDKPIPSTQLRKRASNYIYEYNKVMKDETSARQFRRPIILAMVKDGFDNFIMYPLAETNPENHGDMEKFFINKFDTIKNGYNVNPAAANMHKVGTKLMAKDKLLRSEGIISVNLNRKELIISDSMKLFADYLGSSKDMIKNSNRKARPYKGWFIFYIDTEKRHYILNGILDDSLTKNGNGHSDAAKTHYKELVSIIDEYLRDFTLGEQFSDFTILDPLVYKD